VRIIQFALTTSALLSLPNTLECGQSFRWKKQPDGSYTGIVKGIPALVSEKDNTVFIKTIDNAKQDMIQFWSDYFDLQQDYKKILSSYHRQFSHHPFTLKAIEYGSGLRLLQQDAWEMLISYIISQRRCIPKIAAAVEELAKRKGKKVELDEYTFYSFPTPQELAELSEADLRKIGLGYRADYIVKAVQDVIDKKIILDNLRSLPLDESLTELMKLRGVGPKVANCVCLFGLGKYDAFPVDTWIKKANEYYDGKLDASLFGEYAGIAQEYIFHYIRHIEIK
jgi:N-glycosylase/DNA lyase